MILCAGPPGARHTDETRHRPSPTDPFPGDTTDPF